MANPAKIETRKRPTIARQAKRASKSTAVSSTKEPASGGYNVGYGRPPRWTQFKPKRAAIQRAGRRQPAASKDR
jgi:hypothetical protein